MKNSLDRDKIAHYIVDVMLKKKRSDDTDFKEWLEVNEFAAECVRDFSDKNRLSEKLNQFNHSEKVKDANLLVRQLKQREHRRKRLIRSVAAAAVLLLVSTVLWYGRTEQQELSSETIIATEVAVEAPKLILADGNSIALIDVQDSVIAEGVLNGAGMVKLTSSAINKTVEIQLNRLVVPSKYTYSVTLPDGTKVTLNANSELIFPQSFGDVREVELKGEAYFDVAKEKNRPFIVKSNDLKIEVHGTKFNVNGYNSSNIQTFLSSGSVSVTAPNETTVMLKPMQVANFQEGALRVEEVIDENGFLAWLSDDFVFNAQSINETISCLEHWYGVTFDKTFVASRPVFITAMFSRQMNIEEIISSIEKIAGIKIYTVNGVYHIKQ